MLTPTDCEGATLLIARLFFASFRKNTSPACLSSVQSILPVEYAIQFLQSFPARVMMTPSSFLDRFPFEKLQSLVVFRLVNNFSLFSVESVPLRPFGNSKVLVHQPHFVVKSLPRAQSRARPQAPALALLWSSGRRSRAPRTRSQRLDLLIRAMDFSFPKASRFSVTTAERNIEGAPHKANGSVSTTTNLIRV